GSLFIRKALRPDKQQRFALILRQLRQSATEIRQVQLAMLLRRGHELCSGLAVNVLNLAPGLAQVREIGVAQDRKQPGFEVGADRKLLAMSPSLEQGL